MKSKKKQSIIAQEIQDKIFRKMSADKKLALGAQLWSLAKALTGGKLYYYAGNNRSKTVVGKYR